MKHNCREELKVVALRVTPARLGVLELLEKTDKPLDVITMINYLERQGINADPVTSFRIINLFTEKGLTRRVQFQEGKFRYELSSREDHHHLICMKCDSIQDISDCGVELLEKRIKKKKKFLIKKHSLEFFGLCINCQK